MEVAARDATHPCNSIYPRGMLDFWMGVPQSRVFRAREIHIGASMGIGRVLMLVAFIVAKDVF